MDGMCSLLCNVLEYMIGWPRPHTNGRCSQNNWHACVCDCLLEFGALLINSLKLV